MINFISPKNSHITLVRKLTDKKYREQYGLFVVEGENLVKDAFKFNQKVEFILCSDTFAHKHEDVREYWLNDDNTTCFAVDDKTFGKLCDTVSNQGVLAVVACTKKALRKPMGKCLVLDGIQDPANVGAILRTAAAAGYNDIYMCECSSPYSAKSLRSGMSAQYILNIFEADREKILDLLFDWQLICADMSGDSVFTTEVNKNHALVLGNEGNGVSKETRERCEKIISIPMKNNIESLNVAVSAGILMYGLSEKDF